MISRDPKIFVSRSGTFINRWHWLAEGQCATASAGYCLTRKGAVKEALRQLGMPFEHISVYLEI